VTFDEFLASMDRSDLILGRVAPLSSRFAVLVRSVADFDLRQRLVRELHDEYRQLAEGS
jgi:hypothetical protein